MSEVDNKPASSNPIQDTEISQTKTKSEIGKNKCTPELVEQAFGLAKELLYQKDMCIALRISPETFMRWTDPEGKWFHEDFADAIKRGETEGKRLMLNIIRKASIKSWQAAAWMMERRYPKEFALNQSIHLEGGVKIDPPSGAQLAEAARQYLEGQQPQAASVAVQ